MSAFLPAKALIVDKCQASDLVNLKNIPNPDYNPQNPSGAKYWPGIKDAYILPCTAVEDEGLASQKLLQADNSPFYFIVNCPYWVCRKTFDTGDGATYTETVTIGTSETDSTDFKQTTSWTASVKVGFEAGGASAEASFSLTEEFELETDKSITTSTETTGTIELKLKGAKNVQFWQLFSAIRVYRSTGEIISEIDYGRSDNLILPEGVEKAETKSAA
jgi:hypothetical protein